MFLGLNLRGGGMFQPTEFICDHPFVMLITQNSTGNIIFYGKIADLKSAKTTSEKIYKEFEDGNNLMGNLSNLPKAQRDELLRNY